MPFFTHGSPVGASAVRVEMKRRATGTGKGRRASLARRTDHRRRWTLPLGRVECACPATAPNVDEPCATTSPACASVHSPGAQRAYAPPLRAPVSARTEGVPARHSSSAPPSSRPAWPSSSGSRCRSAAPPRASYRRSINPCPTRSKMRHRPTVCKPSSGTPRPLTLRPRGARSKRSRRRKARRKFSGPCCPGHSPPPCPALRRAGWRRGSSRCCRQPGTSPGCR